MHRRSPLRPVAGFPLVVCLLVATALLASGCGIDTDTLQTAATADPSDTGSGDPVQIETPTTSPPTTTTPFEASDLLDVADDLQDFWAEQLPALYGVEYTPVESDRIVAATSDTVMPPCDGEVPPFDYVSGNAFAAGCSEGILVAWDAEGLMPGLEADFGPVAPATVVAHEWGHVAQFQAGVDASTVVMEQQADCFAGAWLADLVDDPEGLGSLAMANPLDSALSAVVTFRDSVGSSATDPGAHGTGFDRVRALQDGVERGAEYCARYPESPLPLVDLPFIDEQDAATGGNIPVEDLVAAAVPDLNDFYTQLVPGFRGATEQDVLDDEDTMAVLTDLSERIGDNAAGLVLGLIWAGFAQQAAGVDPNQSEADLLLQRTCMTGGWFAYVFNGADDPDRTLRLSPGDLDEAILGLIDLGGGGEGKDTGGSVFRLVAALRQGVIEGFNSCGL